MEKLLVSINNCVKKLEQTQPRYSPVYYILISALLLTTNSLLGKLIKNVSSSQIVYIRALIFCFINTSVTKTLRLNLYNFSTEIYKKLFMRSVFGCLGTLFFYQAIKMISISEGQVLYRTSPLWTSLMAILYLKTEQFSKDLFVNLGLCFFGIILIAQPPQLMQLFGYQNSLEIIDHHYHLLGVFVMLFAAFFSSIIQVLINTLAKQINQLVILQYFSIISIIVSTTTLVIDSSQAFIVPNSYETCILLLIGITAYLSQLLMNRAYMTGDLTEISMLGQSQVIYGYIFDIILGTHLSIFSILGTIIVGLSLVKVVLDKSKKNKNNQEK